MTKREEFQQHLKPGDWIQPFAIVDDIVHLYYERYDDEVRYDKTHQVGDYKYSMVVFRQFCYPDGRIKRNTPECERLSFVWPPKKQELKVVEKVKKLNPVKFEQWLQKKKAPSSYHFFEYHVEHGTAAEVKNQILALFESMDGSFTFSDWLEKGQAVDLGINLLDFMPYGYCARRPNISFELFYDYGEMRGKEILFTGLRFINLFEIES